VRRWVTVWILTVLVLLGVWGVLALLSDSMTTHEDRPTKAQVRVRVSEPSAELRVTATRSSAPSRPVAAPHPPRPAGGSAVVPDGWNVEKVAGLTLAIPPDWSVDDEPLLAVDRATPDAGWRSAADLVGPGELPAQVAVAGLPSSWADATGGWSEQRDIPVPGAQEATLETAERSTRSGGTVLHARVVVRKVVDGPAQVVDLRLPPDSAGGVDLLDAFVGSLSVR
jgi:hypothetical protein